jgi:putative transposase
MPVGTAHPTITTTHESSLAMLLVGAAHPTGSRFRRREGEIWQRRFWEHMIRDDEDYRMHCDYVHFNPVKHSLVSSPKDWPYSTFHQFVKKGIYSENWGSANLEFPENMGGE